MTLFTRFPKFKQALKNSLVSLVLLLTLSMGWAAPALASTYGSGTYGSCPYSSGCSATTPSSSGSSPSSSSSDQILLNDYSEFTTDSGKQLTLDTGQVVSFDVTDTAGQTQRYTITVEQITDTTVVVLISGVAGNITLKIGVPQQFDVNGDGKPDIEITLNSIQNGSASITFKGLVKGAETTFNTPPSKSQTQPAVKQGRSKLIWLWISLIALGVIILVWLIIARRRRHGSDTTTTFTPSA